MSPKDILASNFEILVTLDSVIESTGNTTQVLYCTVLYCTVLYYPHHAGPVIIPPQRDPLGIQVTSLVELSTGLWEVSH